MLLKTFAEYPPRKRIGILAIILGILATFASSPFDTTTANVNLKEIAAMNESDITCVTVQDLAGWLISGKADYRLLDIRSNDQYQKYNIPNSENIPVDELLNSDLSRNEKIVLYGDNDITSTQAWFVLTASKYYGAAILKGGMKAWRDEILFPVCTCSAFPTKAEKEIHAKKNAVSKFFGGSMRSGGNIADEEEVELPKIQPPAKIKVKKPKKKKKREGC